MTTPEIIPVTAETVTQRRLSSVMTTTQSKFMFHEIEIKNFSKIMFFLFLKILKKKRSSLQKFYAFI